MKVQTDIRAGSCRCSCGRSFISVGDINVHILTFNGNGLGNHYQEGDA
jgi:hypothetical protein